MSGIIHYLWQRQQFRQTKRMLNGLGIAFDKEQYAQYTQKLVQEKQEVVSVAGLIVQNKLDAPVTRRNCKTYNVEWKPSTYPIINENEDDVKKCRRRTIDRAQERTQSHLPAIQANLRCLSAVVGETLQADFERNLRKIVLNHSNTWGNSDRGFACDQAWTIAIPGTNKTAPIAA